MPVPESISTRLRRIEQLAEEAPDMAFHSLNHHLDLDLLREAWARTRKDGAVGVDHQSAEDYAEDLDANLLALLVRVKEGSYRAPPVRRVHIPKGKGRGTRPIGIPTFEDKVLQRAVAMLLSAVYEPLFRDCSYGFRPRRSAHQALEALRGGALRMGGGWILEFDIQSYFDTIGHAELQQILRKRVRDGVLCRLVGKWLNAGVLENGKVYHPGSGSPQGGVISPILSNIYLHEVLDTWFEDEMVPQLQGAGFLIRYADDGVLCFSSEKDARKVLEALATRFEAYGLRLHPEKTRLVPFRHPDSRRNGNREGPGTFDFLGFTHYWGRSRKGAWVIKQLTARDRVQRILAGFQECCRKIRHEALKAQRTLLGQKLMGHYGYFGVTGNFRALQRVYRGVRYTWYQWLRRRSQRRHLKWDRFQRLLDRFRLPLPRIVHRYAAC